MPTLDCQTDRRGGLTLVECTVHNDTSDRRCVRVTNRLDGPVRAPPAEALGPSWTDGTATCTLAPGERAALGYATPAPPREPPAELTHAVTDRGAGAAQSTVDGSVGPAPCSPARAAGEAGTDGAMRPDGAGIALPPAVGAWLSALERRVEAVEDGDCERSAGHATVVVDRETLAALERRAAALGERLATARAGAREPVS
ncbi:MAG: hypothetical protein ABEJ05_02640 [Haloglomus sp.]